MVGAGVGGVAVAGTVVATGAAADVVGAGVVVGAEVIGAAVVVVVEVVVVVAVVVLGAPVDGVVVVGGSGGAGGAAKSNLSGLPQHSLTTPVVEAASIVAHTWLGEAAGCDWSTRAATPATCGAAIDVPERNLDSVSLAPGSAERIPTPGA
jgi:hypothetical protein